MCTLCVYIYLYDGYCVATGNDRSGRFFADSGRQYSGVSVGRAFKRARRGKGLITTHFLLSAANALEQYMLTFARELKLHDVLR